MVADYGVALADDPGRCEGLMRDLCGSCRLEINVLVGAARAQVPADLLRTSAGVPLEMQHARLAVRLRSELGIAEEASRWAVNTWAFALGLPAVEMPAPPDDEGPSPPPRQARRKKRPPKVAATGDRADRAVVEDVLADASPSPPPKIATTLRPPDKPEGPTASPGKPASRGAYVWLAIAAIGIIAGWIFYARQAPAPPARNAAGSSSSTTASEPCPSGTYSADGRYIPPAPRLGSPCVRAPNEGGAR